jgi:hypothetical protein
MSSPATWPVPRARMPPTFAKFWSKHLVFIKIFLRLSDTLLKSPSTASVRIIVVLSYFTDSSSVTILKYGEISIPTIFPSSSTFYTAKPTLKLFSPK